VEQSVLYRVCSPPPSSRTKPLARLCESDGKSVHQTHRQTYEVKSESDPRRRPVVRGCRNTSRTRGVGFMRLSAKMRKSVAARTYERKIVRRLTKTILIFFPITKFPTLSDSPVQLRSCPVRSIESNILRLIPLRGA
jgi:hypothetical protein